ncbi:hypothetical protein BH11PSE5_BH11PSE5_04910 [soil metagenome]
MQIMDHNALYLLSVDDTCRRLIEMWMTDCSWSCHYKENVGQLLADVSDRVPAIVLIDSGVVSDIATTVRALRSLPGSASALPILLLTPHVDEAGQGCNAVLHMPLVQDRLLDAVSEWTGPLDDKAFRSLDNPYYRLIRVVGQSRAAGMLTRCIAALRQALEKIAKGAAPQAIAHDVAGMCGMMGFEKLSTAWSAVEYDEPDALEKAIELTQATIERKPSR